MPKFGVTGIVVGSKYLGEFEADNAEAAVDLAMESDAVYVSMCHQCSDECEDPAIDSAEASPIAPPRKDKSDVL